MKFHLITVVWGEEYTKLFLDVCLPTQLAAGNLPAFRNYPAVYKIYTTAKDARIIVDHPAYSTLSKIIETQIKVFNVANIYTKQHHHQLMNYCHNHAIIDANRDSCVMIILCPDCAWSNQAFANIIKLTEKQKKVVAVLGLSVVSETFVPEFLQRFCTNNQTSISVSSRDLVKICLENLHPYIQSYFWENEGISNVWPSYFYWNVNGTGLLARTFRMHPLMINPVVKNVLSPDVIDGEYISLACPELNDFYVVEDSDQVFIVNLVKRDKEDLNANILRNGQKSGIVESSNWLKQFSGTHVKPCHKLFFQHKVKIHSQPISATWREVEEESDIIMNLISQGAE